jgi:serine/threonine protein kinase
MTVDGGPVMPATQQEGQQGTARVGRFEVRRLVGEGAFGRVYEAYDPSLKRVVALKVAKQGDDERRCGSTIEMSAFREQ